MSEFDELQLPSDFSGTARLFPLPNFVMFPGAIKALHIFESRYCEMLVDAMAGDRLIAMSLLEPGWEVDYDGVPTVAPVVCIGRVATHAPIQDGKHNILLAGLCRAKIKCEPPVTHAFRTAEVELLHDEYPTGNTQRRTELRRELVDVFRKQMPKSTEVQKQFEQLLASQLPLGSLTDIVAFTVDLHVEVKQQLLSSSNVDRRAEMLVRHLQMLNKSRENSTASESFPPKFSAN